MSNDTPLPLPKVGEVWRERKTGRLTTVLDVIHSNGTFVSYAGAQRRARTDLASFHRRFVHQSNG